MSISSQTPSEKTPSDPAGKQSAGKQSAGKQSPQRQSAQKLSRPSYLASLNEQQRAAVLECTDPLLVLAGAGSGKTRVITTKIVHLIEALSCSPYTILAVTFTNKAAAEMKGRVLSMVDGGADEVMVRTFHSFGAWLLRRHASRLSLSENFTIYDDEDSLTLLHSLYPSFKRAELKPYTKSISRAKDSCLRPDDDLSGISRDPKFPEMYAAYERKLRAIGNADFGDLISRSVELLREHPDVRQKIQNRFRAILVDEYQDSNGAQFQLLRELWEPGIFICVVGDDDQSIYRFRGAELKNILDFPKIFPATRVVKLEENYRSTGSILKIAEAVVANNFGRHGKTLWTRKEEGEKAKLIYFSDQFAEAQFCAGLVDRDRNYDGTAVLYRTNAQSAAFETVFMRLGIPYKIVGALRFYDREEVKDALAILSLILNPADEVAFRRIINKPSRGIGEVSLNAVLAAAAQEQGSCTEGLRQAVPDLKGKARRGAEEFLTWYDAALGKLDGYDLAGFTREVLTDSGIIEYHRRQDEISMTQKVSNLEELVNAAGVYPPGRAGITQFLESLELDPTRLGKRDPSDQPGVTLITMHNTKGLEFDRVIITGLEEGLFPGRANETDEDIEEERRIFYVSITRARRELYFTSCQRRSIWGQTRPQMPSRFIDELPMDQVTLMGSDPYESSGFSGRRQSGFTDSDDYPGFGRRIKPDASRQLDASRQSDASSFAAGDRVYHDEYGAGYITESRFENGREIVAVRFDTGQTAKFIPRYARLEKIAGD